MAATTFSYASKAAYLSSELELEVETLKTSKTARSILGINSISEASTCTASLERASLCVSRAKPSIRGSMISLSSIVKFFNIDTFNNLPHTSSKELHEDDASGY